MSWSGFKKNVGRATTQVMMKTGHVEKTSDREYEVEERRYRTLESASLRLQKEAKGYLDSLRAMTASQMRIAETIDAFYGDSGAKDGVSRSYKQAVEDLDAETVKALDGPYRTTVLEPINRFCAYFPDINECIKKRNHKMLDYDAMRSKVKKLTEKPDKDPAKLPRTEKETEMVNDPSSFLDLPSDYFDCTTADDDSFIEQSPSKTPKPLGGFQKHRQQLARLAEDDETCLQSIEAPASPQLQRKSSLWKRLSSVTAHAHDAFWGRTEVQKNMEPGQPPPSPIAILRRSPMSARQSPLSESFRSPSLAPISETIRYSPVNMNVNGHVFNPAPMNGGMVPRSAYVAQSSPSQRSLQDTPSRSTTMGKSFLSDHSSPEDTPSRAASMGPSFLFKRSPLVTPSRKHSMPLQGTGSSEFPSPSDTPSRFPAGRFTALNAPSTTSVVTMVGNPAKDAPNQPSTQACLVLDAPDSDSVTVDSVASSAASWQTTSTGAYTDVEPDLANRDMNDCANSHAGIDQDAERKDSMEPTAVLGIESLIDPDSCSKIDAIVEHEDPEHRESESAKTGGRSQARHSGQNVTGLGITSTPNSRGGAQTRPVHPLERREISTSDDAQSIELSRLDCFDESSTITESMSFESHQRSSPLLPTTSRVPATAKRESVISYTSSYDEELEQALYDVEQGLHEHTDRSSSRHRSKLVARSPVNEDRGRNLSMIKFCREGPPDSSQRPMPRNVSSTSTTGAWEGYTDGVVRHSAVPLPLYPSDSVTALPKIPPSGNKRTPFFQPSELEDIMQPLKQEYIEKQTDLLVQAKSAYDQLNEQLTNELPQLIDLRVPYLDPSFEALVKIQLRFCAEAYSRMAQVQQYLAAETRDQYASGDLDARVEDVLGQIRELSIAGTV